MLDKIDLRLQIGRERYGHGVRVNDNTREWGTHRNSWAEMAEEELLDCVVYVVADYIRQFRDKGETGPPEFKNDFYLNPYDDDNALIQHIWKNKDRMNACTTKTMLYSLESLLGMLSRG